MGTMASQITSLTTVYSTVYSEANQRKHQSSASLAFVRGIHRWIPRTQGQLRGKCFPLMTSSLSRLSNHAEGCVMFAMSSRWSSTRDVMSTRPSHLNINSINYIKQLIRPSYCSRSYLGAPGLCLTKWFKEEYYGILATISTALKPLKLEAVIKILQLHSTSLVFPLPWSFVTDTIINLSFLKNTDTLFGLC